MQPVLNLDETSLFLSYFWLGNTEVFGFEVLILDPHGGS